MADKFNVRFVGFDKLMQKIGKMPQALKDEVEAETEAAAKLFVQLAKRAAPKDTGRLTGAITYFNAGDLKYEVVAGVDYAPFVEWGTITRVSVPGELQAYAMQFKGKGLRENGGIFPHPFFFPQLPIVEASFVKNVERVVQDLWTK